MPLKGLSLPATLTRFSTQRRCISDRRPFAPGDRVVLRRTSDRSAAPILTRPLQPGRRIEGQRGVIEHDDIIGKRVREVVKSSLSRSLREGTEFRLHEVTLEEYVRLSRRLVTPIYGADANLIVSLFDLHPEDTEQHGDQPGLEILEAGTGHGALTLYLSRAIHASNPRIIAGGTPVTEAESIARRRAVIHTIDVSQKFSAHAEDVVRGFRQGIYARNVDFHVGDVSDWVNATRSLRGHQPFLSHAFLDLPAAHSHLETVVKALRTDGTLVVFKPSITQITACATGVKDARIPLDLERVIELGVNGGSGGRDWDVRFVRPRAEVRNVEEKQDGERGEQMSAEESDDLIVEDQKSDAETSVDQARPWSMICRPKVGERIIGGGFLGVWKKRRDTNMSTADMVA